MISAFNNTVHANRNLNKNVSTISSATNECNFPQSCFSCVHSEP